MARSRYRNNSLLAVAVLAGLVDAAVAAPAQNPLPVTVRCEAADVVAGAPLRVLAMVTRGGLFGETPHTPVFDSQGRAALNLPAGVYRFEVLGHRYQGSVVCLKSRVLTIRRRAEVELSALPPQPIELLLDKRGPLALDEWAIRAESATGEFVWKRDAGQPLPRVIASEDQTYRVRLMGRDRDLVVPVWTEIQGDCWTVEVRERKLFAGTFQVRSEEPEVSRATALFAFPRSRIELKVTPDAEILTNRRFLSFAYRVETPAGRIVQTHPQLGNLSKTETFSLGGPFQPVAWYGLMKSQTKDSGKCLIWGADLVDPRGHLVNTEKSTIDWQISGHAPWGEVQPDSPLTKEQEKLCAQARGVVRVRASWCVDKPVSVELPAVRFQEFSLARIKTTGPPHWKVQIGNYLAKAARVYQCIEEVDGKPGKHSVRIHWHRKGGAALATVGGKNAWINMPFGQLIRNFEPYATPWALPHEMLHNFGYGHGPKMSAAQEATKHKLELFRWFMADHPELAPDAAFARFRLFQRGAPWEVK